jgi:PTH1 family peptidyl-tRNA hydrolase
VLRLLVGLGNPGPQYHHTRHNAGFDWLDAVADRLGATLQPQRSLQGEVAKVGQGDEALWLLKPQTFMNHSGRAVAALARFYKIPAQAILVAHDELDLSLGTLKLKCGGGHAGHNGLRDIHAQLGDPNYWRLRLGIGHPGQREAVIAWVLQKPPTAQREAIQQAIARSLESLDDLRQGRMTRATTALHTAPPAAG